MFVFYNKIFSFSVETMKQTSYRNSKLVGKFVQAQRNTLFAALKLDEVSTMEPDDVRGDMIVDMDLDIQVVEYNLDVAQSKKETIENNWDVAQSDNESIDNNLDVDQSDSESVENNQDEMLEELDAIESNYDDEEQMPPEPKKKTKAPKGFMQVAINHPEFSAVCMSKGQTPGAISSMAAAANYANNAPNKGISRSNINEKHRKHEKIVAESIYKRKNT